MICDAPPTSNAAYYIMVGGVVVMIVTVQSVPITTKVVSLNPVHGKVYSKQHCVIKFVSDLRQVCGFLWVLWFPPPIKLIIII